MRNSQITYIFHPAPDSVLQDNPLDKGGIGLARIFSSYGVGDLVYAATETFEKADGQVSDCRGYSRNAAFGTAYSSRRDSSKAVARLRHNKNEY